MITWGVIVGLALFAQQEPPVPGSAEADADAAIADFRLAFYRPGASEDEQVLAIRTLGLLPHPKTLAVLSPLMTEGKVVATRIAAALMLAEFGKVDGTTPALIKAYQRTSRIPVLQSVRIRIIQTLGELKDPAAGGLICSAILDPDPWIARAAAKAAGVLRGSSAIDPLIRRLQYLESKEGEKPASGGGVPDPKSGKPADDIDRHHKSERQVLHYPIHEALTSITRQRHSCAELWAKWWAQNRKDYKVPP